MGDIVRYGENLVFRNCENDGSSFLSLIWKGVQNPASQPTLWTEIAVPGKNSAVDYIWKIVPGPGSKKKAGDPVSSGDSINIKITDDAGAQRFLAVNKVDHKYVMADKDPGNLTLATWLIGVVTKIKRNPDGSVTADGELKSTFEYGDGSYISLTNTSLSRNLYVAHEAGQTEPFKNMVGTEPFTQATPITFWWNIAKSVSAGSGGGTTGGGTPGGGTTGGGNPGGGTTGGEGDGWFNLPPHIKFGVTTLVNSSAEQTVYVFVNGETTPKATFKGVGLEDKNLQTQILDSGNGKVQVIVEANGKKSKLGSRQVDIFQKAYFGLLASEDGGDDSFNDSLVILNWPIG
jgi:hypothetical protein